jgi:hypothetical protein
MKKDIIIPEVENVFTLYKSGAMTLWRKCGMLI